MVRQTTPEEAAAMLRSVPEAVYLDVRTEGEFEAGHPAGAYNVPLLELDPETGRPRPNPSFERAVQRTLDRHTKVIVGCQSGGRSQRAAEILASLGYRDVSNMQGGFGGARDQSGEVVVPGWQDAGLPVETDAQPGRSWSELAAAGEKG